MRPREFEIDLSRQFEHLRNAPIVEAVIDFRARAEQPWNESDISRKLKEMLPDYPKSQSQHGFSLHATFSLNKNEPSPTASQENLGWTGLKLNSEDGFQVGTFTRDGFTFSRLRPYENWNRLKEEALRLWNVHNSLAGSTAVLRTGVRYINRIEAPSREFQLEDYYKKFESVTGDLPLANFFHHDVLEVPGNQYKINVIRTIQSPGKGQSNAPGLIFDIDVFLEEPFFPKEDIIRKRLDEMRCLKNHIFFEGVTQLVLENSR